MIDKMNNEPLHELMRKAQNGDKIAYNSLLKQISPLVFAMVKKRIFDQEMVEDVYQNVMLNIHRARHTFNPEHKFKPWLFSVTKNTVYDYLRKNKKRFGVEVLVGDFFTNASDLNSDDQFEVLQQALKKLPKNYQDAIVLLKIEGLSLQEAADQLKISLSAMKVRAHRAYDRLKKVLIEDIAIN